MSQINFEMREYTRPATDEERAEQLINLLSTMNTIDTTRSEAKTKAAEFKAQISNLVDREDDLRIHLEAGTYLEGVEVHAVVNEMSGNTEYFNREGNEIVELRHPTSKQDKRDEAERKQMKMFGDPDGAQKFANEMSDAMGGVPVSVNGVESQNSNSFSEVVRELAEDGVDVSVVSRYHSDVDKFEASSKKLLDEVTTRNEASAGRSDFEGQTWAVGDISRTPESELFIVLTISTDGENVAEVITVRGNVLRINLDDIYHLKYASGIDYEYIDEEDILIDFRKGFFTPFFEKFESWSDQQERQQPADVAEIDSVVLADDHTQIYPTTNPDERDEYDKVRADMYAQMDAVGDELTSDKALFDPANIDALRADPQQSETTTEPNAARPDSSTMQTELPTVPGAPRKNQPVKKNGKKSVKA